MNAVGTGTEQNAQDVALSVYQTLVGRKENDVEYVPTIEEVQDIVETKLMDSQFKEAATARSGSRCDTALIAVRKKR